MGLHVAVACSVHAMLGSVCSLFPKVPSVAFENVYFKDNTSVMQEEVLAHRLGLVPLAVDPDMLEAKVEGDPATDTNTLVRSGARRSLCGKSPCGRSECSMVWSQAVLLLSQELSCLPSVCACPPPSPRHAVM